MPPSLFQIKFSKPEKKWRVNISATLSMSGKRERHFFATKLQAQAFVEAQKARLANDGTAGAPLERFVRAFQAAVTDSMRITNSDDPVPRFPISPFYTHVTGFICINDKCVVTEATVDMSWWRRLFSLPSQIDYKAPIADHSCTLYCERLAALVKEPIGI